MQGGGENFVLTRDNMPRLKVQLQAAIKQMTDFEKLKSHIDMTVTAEGLRIELSESAGGTFFNSGSAKLNSDGAELLVTLAQELSGLPNKLSIEGHTDSQPYSLSATSCNWELSADRANAARRVMQSNGIRSDQINSSSRLRRPAPSQAGRPSRLCQPSPLRNRSVHRQEPQEEGELEKKPESHPELGKRQAAST
jgi:chemotaxis protein MotB